MTARWETEFWKLLSPDTARRLKIELGLHAKYREPPVETEAQFAAREFGIGSDTTDANSAPPVGVPDTAGGALPIGTLICLRRNSDIMGVVQPPGHYTRPGEVCVKWDDRDDLYNIQASEIEAV